jgi:hypothetical protein
LLEVLAVVREDLDEVEQNSIDDITGVTDAEMEMEMEEEEEKGKDKADVGAVMAPHKDTLEPRALPLRSKSGKHNKGGAANAHEFTKSLGRSSG